MLTPLRALVDLLVPSTCDGCGRRSPPPWCTTCDEAFVVAAPSDPCGRCGAAVGPDHRCWAGATPLAATVVLGPWTGGVARAVTRAKLVGRREVLLSAGALIGEVLAAREIAVDVVTGVPTDRRRARARGGDHTHALAAGAAAVLGIPRVSPFAPVHGAPDRTGPGGRRTRDEPVAVQVRRRADVAGRRVLLVDDVVTTGTTIATVAAALVAADARTIVGGVVGRAGAHTLRPPDRRRTTARERP